SARLFGTPAVPGHFKDAFDEYLVRGNSQAVNPSLTGTKVAAHYELTVPARGQVEVLLRLCAGSDRRRGSFPADAGRVFRERIAEADAFHALKTCPDLTEEEDRVVRQARAGLLWSKQFYHYIVRDWLAGDPEPPPPPSDRLGGRNNDWSHFYARDVLSMPDKW